MKFIVRCKTCHYSLKGLAEHRCPECGNAFDPDDPSTLAAPAIRWRKAMVICCAISMLCTVALSLTFINRFPTLHGQRSTAVGFAVIVPCVFGAMIFAASFIGFLLVALHAWKTIAAISIAILLLAVLM